MCILKYGQKIIFALGQQSVVGKDKSQKILREV